LHKGYRCDYSRKRKGNNGSLMLDLLGFDLEEAVKIITEAGQTFKIEKTHPQKKELQDGIEKVINQEFIDNTYILTVCKVPDAFR